MIYSSCSFIHAVFSACSAFPISLLSSGRINLFLFSFLHQSFLTLNLALVTHHHCLLTMYHLSPFQRSVGGTETFKPLITLLVPVATSFQPSLSRDILQVISLTLHKILLLLLPQEISRVLGAPCQKTRTKYTF